MEFVLHAPKRSLATTTDPNDLAPKSYALMVHKSDVDTPLINILEGRLSSKEEKDAPQVPDWVRELVPASLTAPSSSTDDPSDVLFLLLKLPPTPPKKQYHSLDRTLPLIKLLRKKRFIEWPTIHVWLADEFEGGHIIGREMPAEDDVMQYPGPYKKRKLNTQAGKKVLSGLVGGYASESSDAEGEDEEEELEEDADAEGEAEGMMGLMEYDSGGEEVVWTDAHRGGLTSPFNLVCKG